MKIINAALRTRDKRNESHSNRVTWGTNKIYCCAVSEDSALRNDMQNVWPKRSEKNASLTAHNTSTCAPPSYSFCTRDNTADVFSFEPQAIVALTSDTYFAHQSLTLT